MKNLLWDLSKVQWGLVKNSSRKNPVGNLLGKKRVHDLGEAMCYWTCRKVKEPCLNK